MLHRTLSAEMLKLRRTPAVLLAISVPLFLCLLYILLFNFAGSYTNLAPKAFWEQLIGITNFLWNSFLLPLMIAVLAGLVLGVEYNDNQWKTLLTFPPARGSVYLAKVITVVLLMLLSTLVLFVGLALVASVQTHFAALHRTNITEMLNVSLRAWWVSLPIVAFHVWLSSRTRSFAVAVGAGFAGTLVAMFAANGDQLTWAFVPWAYPSNDIIPKYGTLQLLLGTGLFPLVLGLGLWDFSRRDIA
jgi:lantibiotic transport system permease protein